MRLGIRRYVLPLLAIFALLTMALAACGSSTPVGGPAADSKQILHYPIVNNAADLKTLDPARIGDYYSQQMAMLVFPRWWRWTTSSTLCPTPPTACPPSALTG